MKTTEQFKKELFINNAIHNEKWFSQIVDDTLIYAKEKYAIEVIQSIFDYEKESGSSIIDYDRTPEDVLNIYLKKQ